MDRLEIDINGEILNEHAGEDNYFSAINLPLNTIKFLYFFLKKHPVVMSQIFINAMLNV